MARDLSYKLFYSVLLNGTRAIVPERVYADARRRSGLEDKIKSDDRYENSYASTVDQGLHHFEEAPVFCFADSYEPKYMPDLPLWFIGDSMTHHLLEKYIEKMGGQIVCPVGETLWAPVITRNDMATELFNGHAAMKHRLRRVATEAQFEAEFGITTAGLRRMSVELLGDSN